MVALLPLVESIADGIAKHFDSQVTTLRGQSNRFAAPHLSVAVKKSQVPKKTRANTSWASIIWLEWVAYSLANEMSKEKCSYNLDGDITKAACDLFLGSRVCPRGQEGKSYSPDSLYQPCCGLQRALRNADRDVNLFDDFQFAPFSL